MMSIRDLCKEDLCHLLALCQMSTYPEATIVDMLNGVATLLPDAAILALQIGNVRAGEPASTRHINLSFPEEWLQEYAKCNYFSIDPVKQSLLYRTHPCAIPWSPLLNSQSVNRAFVGQLLDFQLTAGVTASVKSGNKERISFFVFGGRRVEQDPRSQVILEYMAPYLHEAWNRHGSNEPAQWMPPATQPATCEAESLLTRREADVLSWARHGKTNWEISQVLNISERTVKFHVRNILCKLNASSRAHAVAIALSQGLIRE